MQQYLLLQKPIPFILAAMILTACSSTGNLQNRDFSHLQLAVEQPVSADGHYRVYVSGFEDSQNPDNEFKAVRKRLNRHEWDDIHSVRRSESEANPELEVAVNNSPESLNRVLWLLGKEHYRNHSVDHLSDVPDGGWVIISSMPELIGGSKELQNKVRYPDELAGSGVKGEVVLQFIVDSYGEVESPEVIESLHPAADEEALRTIRLAEFRPGMQNGLPIRVQMKLSLNIKE